MAKLNRTQVLESVVAEQMKPASELPKFSVGDTIDVHYKIIEGDKERIQVFQGVLLARTGRGIHEMITVRRIVANEGVERTFPLNSPRRTTSIFATASARAAVCATSAAASRAPRVARVRQADRAAHETDRNTQAAPRGLRAFSASNRPTLRPPCASA